MLFALIPIWLIYCICKERELHHSGRNTHYFRNLSIAVSLWAIALFAMTELLSCFRLMKSTSVLCGWLCIDVALLTAALLLTIRDQVKPKEVFLTEYHLVRRLRALPLYCKIAYPALFIAAVCIVGLGRLTVPYNWDSMTYHLPRIMLWVQNQSVAHFAANDTRLLSSPVLAEFVNLHLYLLTGSDKCFNLLQSFSFVFCCLGVYAVSKKLRLEHKWRITAVLLFISMPIAFGEALTTQVDVFSTVWMMIFAYVFLDLIAEEHIQIHGTTLENVVLLGLCLGLGYITKQSVCIAMAVFCMGLLIVRVQKKDRAAILVGSVAIVGGIALVIVLPEIMRNLVSYHAIASKNVGSQQLIGTLKPNYLLINFVKNLAFNLPNVYITSSGSTLLNLVTGLAKLLNVNLNDPAIAEGGMVYKMNPATDYGHDTAINAIIVWLFLIVTVIALIRLLLTRKKTFHAYAWCATISFLLLMFILRWERFETRYQISFLALLCPMIAASLSDLFENSNALKASSIAIIAFLCISSLGNLFVYHVTIMKDRASDRPYGYFAINRGIVADWALATSTINAKQYKALGFRSTNMYYSYPIWQMCGNVDRIEYIVNTDSNAYQYTDSSFVPDAILWFGSDMQDGDFQWNDGNYRHILDNGAFHLLENSTYSDPAEHAPYLTLETDMVQYLKEINDPRYTVFISAKDEATSGLTDVVMSLLNDLGVQNDLIGKNRWSFLSIVSNGLLIEEKISDKKLEAKGTIEQGPDYSMVSAGFDFGNTSSIKLNGIEYSKNRRGLNIVVYNNQTHLVEDSVCFDTYDACTASR